LYFCGTCIHGIFKQFFYSAAWPLDYFAGSYLVGNVVGQ
jgi:hypothetical protein